MSLGELPRDSSIKLGVVRLFLRLERQRRQLESVENVAEVQFCERGDRLVSHDRSANDRRLGRSIPVRAVSFSRRHLHDDRGDVIQPTAAVCL